jgi:hypothetical protein
MDDHRAETIHEIERLRVLAEWYRDWAHATGSEQVRKTRLDLADTAEAKARALLRKLESEMA